jgi:hypothetical protein
MAMAGRRQWAFAALLLLIRHSGMVGAGGGPSLTCTSGTTYASTFSAGGVVTTSITTSAELNAAFAALNTSNPTGTILDLAPGTYTLDQVTNNFGDPIAYNLQGNVCLQSTGPSGTSIVAAADSRHFTKSAGTLQMVGLTVAGGSSGTTHGGIVISGGQAAFEDLKFYGNDIINSLGNGGALAVTGGTVYLGTGVVFDTNNANDGGHLYISGGAVTTGE